MKKIIEYQLEDGSTVWVEVDEPEQKGTRPVSKAGDVAEKATVLFEEALDKIKPATKALVAILKDLGPDETTVEFGVKFSAKAGIMFASTDTEANFVFKLTWKSQSSSAKS
jgi:hypothetical protein